MNATNNIVGDDVRSSTPNGATEGPVQPRRPIYVRLTPSEARLSKRCLNADANKLRHRMIRRARTRARLGRWWMRQAHLCERDLREEPEFGAGPPQSQIVNPTS